MNKAPIPQNDHSKWNVNDPMNSEIEDGENEDDGIDC